MQDLGVERFDLAHAGLLRLDPHLVVEEVLHLRRRARVEVLPGDVVEKLLSLGRSVEKFDREFLALGGVDPDPAEHETKGGPPEAGHAFGVERPADGVGREQGGQRGHGFEGVAAVPAVVLEELGVVFRGFAVVFQVVFPILVEVAVDGRDDVEGFRQGRKEKVLRDHRVVANPRDDAPLGGEVLRVVVEVLPDDADVRVFEQALEGENQAQFLVEGPKVRLRTEGHADCIAGGPSDADAGDFVPDGFNVAGELYGNRGSVCPGNEPFQFLAKALGRVDEVEVPRGLVIAGGSCL